MALAQQAGLDVRAAEYVRISEFRQQSGVFHADLPLIISGHREGAVIAGAGQMGNPLIGVDGGGAKLDGKGETPGSAVFPEAIGESLE